MSELPPSWEMAGGDDLFSSVRGVTYSKADAVSIPSDGLVPILRANNIADGRIVADDLVYVPAKYVSPEQYLRAGDLLIATSSGSRTVVGKAAAASDEHRRYAFGAFCTVARPRVGGFGDWLSRFARTRAYRDYVEQVALGISINNLRGSDLKSMPIRLAPLPEQRRIVAKIDSLTGKSRRARDHLDHIPRLVEKYKQAVLAAAFRGDLTREWRAERQLSTTWEATSAAHHFEWSSGKNLPSKRQIEGTVPVIGGNGIGGYHNVALIDFPTLVVGRVGAQCGNVHLSSGPAWITDNAIYARSISDHVDLSFAVIFFRNADLNRLAGGSGQPYVNQSTLNALALDLPTIEEQREIVRRVEQMMNWIDRLASEATSARRLIDRLDQAVLAKAFRGELVPQDPEDEPASLLLDRIRAERGAAPKAKRGRRAKAAA